MKLTTVLSCVNENENYYLFIPKQIIFWKKFDIKFIAIFVGNKIPDVLTAYSDNIILWSHNLHLNTAFVAQNLRVYYPSLLELPEDELVMITDMDMLPTNPKYYCDGLEHFDKEDFIYYRYVDKDQIYMCYNAAHPSIWKKVFKTNNKEDIINLINNTYNNKYNGIPGSNGWFIDQEVMYKNLSTYPKVRVLNRPIKRLEVDIYIYNLRRYKGKIPFIHLYDDVHFHRSYKNNEKLIMDCEHQLNYLFTKK